MSTHLLFYSFLGGKVYMRINNFKMKRSLYLKKEWSERRVNEGG